jgi:hypothetical protein
VKTATPTEKAMQQATITANHCLKAAILDVEAQLPGYAKNCPELVAQYMAVCAAVLANKNSRKIA